MAWIYGEILPRLRPGVVVHIHDAFIPGDYPEHWVLEGWGWNEVYLITGFLAFNSAFEVPSGCTGCCEPPGADRPGVPRLLRHRERGGGALWLQRI